MKNQSYTYREIMTQVESWRKVYSDVVGEKVSLNLNIFSDNYCESGKTSPELDEKGYYTGYCQCNCKKCLEGKEHCQGLICRGD